MTTHVRWLAVIWLGFLSLSGAAIAEHLDEKKAAAPRETSTRGLIDTASKLEALAGIQRPSGAGLVERVENLEKHFSGTPKGLIERVRYLEFYSELPSRAEDGLIARIEALEKKHGVAHEKGASLAARVNRLTGLVDGLRQRNGLVWRLNILATLAGLEGEPAPKQAGKEAPPKAAGRVGLIDAIAAAEKALGIRGEGGLLERVEVLERKSFAQGGLIQRVALLKRYFGLQNGIDGIEGPVTAMEKSAGIVAVPGEGMIARVDRLVAHTLRDLTTNQHGLLWRVERLTTTTVPRE